MFGDCDVYLNIKLIIGLDVSLILFSRIYLLTTQVWPVIWRSKVAAARLKSLFNKHNILVKSNFI